MSIVIDSTQVLNNAGTYPAVATGITLGSVANLDVIIATLKTTAAVTRAADLGATLDVYKLVRSLTCLLLF